MRSVVDSPHRLLHKESTAADFPAVSRINDIVGERFHDAARAMIGKTGYR